MNIKHYGKSKVYCLDGKDELFDSKQLCEEFYSWAAQGEIDIMSIDIDSPEYILNDVPKELHSAFKCYAYDKGHSAGEVETILYLKELVSEFLPSILKYGERMKLDK